MTQTLAISPSVRTAMPAITVDDALLVRLRAGDDQAYDDLVRLTGGWMLALARRMLGREDDAMDAVQDAFLNAFKSLEGFDQRSQFTTWLHRIVVNACLMKLRTRRRKPERPITDFLPRFLADGHQEFPTQSWNPDATAGIERDELRTLLRSKIDELPGPFREVILLRDIEELDTETTASLLGTTPAAVKTCLHRARQALRTLLEPHFAETHS